MDGLGKSFGLSKQCAELRYPTSIVKDKTHGYSICPNLDKILCNAESHKAQKSCLRATHLGVCA